MDDVNRFARELADAIAAAVAANPQVEACRERARAAGFEMRVSLEAVVGFMSRESRDGRGKGRGGHESVHPRPPAAPAADVRYHRERSAVSSIPADCRGCYAGGSELEIAGRRWRRAAGGGRAPGSRRVTDLAYRPAFSSARLPAASADRRAPFPVLPPRLRRHLLCRLPCGVRIAQVAAPDRPQVGIQLVDERDARRDVQLHDGRRRRCCRDTSRARAGCCRGR